MQIFSYYFGFVLPENDCEKSFKMGIDKFSVIDYNEIIGSVMRCGMRRRAGTRWAPGPHTPPQPRLSCDQKTCSDAPAEYSEADPLLARARHALAGAREALRTMNEEIETRAEERIAEALAASALLQEHIGARQQGETVLVDRNLLDALINNLPERIAVKDSQGRFVLVNAAMLLHMGASAPEQVVGKTDVDVHSPAVAAQLHADEQAIVQSGQPLINHEEALVDEQTGARSWVLTTEVPVRDSQGAIIGLVRMSRDITRRKLAEQHLALRIAMTRILSGSETRQAAVPQLLEAICTSLGWDLGEFW